MDIIHGVNGLLSRAYILERAREEPAAWVLRPRRFPAPRRQRDRLAGRRHPRGALVEGGL